LELHWPGNGRYTLTGALLYPWQIKRSVECGQRLADWIKAKTSGASFMLVGHSLGCRLILEALKVLDPAHRRRITGVCLMAAAVPVRMIENDELGPAHTPNAIWRILHSRGDNVLGAIFHFGQLFDSQFTRAVGYLGGPSERWIKVGSVEEMYDTWNSDDRYYKHGWYWPGGRREGACEERLDGDEPLPPVGPPRSNDGRSAMSVAEMLGVTMERELPRREQPFGRSVAPEWSFWCRKIGED
jgi:pimeloyl-ACP methyl ester carboxylesterase